MAASAPRRVFMAATAFVVVMATACGAADTPMEFAGALAAGDQKLIKKEGLGPLFHLLSAGRAT
jgi:hypothetical protein